MLPRNTMDTNRDIWQELVMYSDGKWSYNHTRLWESCLWYCNEDHDAIWINLSTIFVNIESLESEYFQASRIAHFLSSTVWSILLQCVWVIHTPLTLLYKWKVMIKLAVRSLCRMAIRFCMVKLHFNFLYCLVSLR